MGMFAMRKPRGFNHSYIYVDERKEKLAKMEENAKRDLGMLPEKEFSPEDIRGKFIEGTTHLKRRKESGRKPMHLGIILVVMAVLIYLWASIIAISMWMSGKRSWRRWKKTPSVTWVCCRKRNSRPRIYGANS